MEFTAYLRFIAALIFVLALIGLLAWLARRFGPGAHTNPTPGRHRRLAIVETRPLDGRRRLILIRRDDVEHLLVLGANGELVVETGIPAPASPPPAELGDDMATVRNERGRFAAAVHGAIARRRRREGGIGDGTR